VKSALLIVALAGCSSSKPADLPLVFGGDRPATLEVPANFDAGKSYPLVMVLHGYGATGFLQEAYFDVKPLVTAGTAFVIAPDGNVDSTGAEFWNADPECCDFDHTNPDDSGYLGGLIDAIEAAYPIDRVYVVGHSNGGYMAYRMACDHADAIGNILVLAGDAASDPTTCNPTQSVSVLHVAGDADTEVPYAMTAMRSVTQWASHDMCAGTFTAGPSFDFIDATAGDETTSMIADGCPTGIDIELWTIAGAPHVPNFNANFEPAFYQWFVDHPRP
jgi:polyhydroxybutyrate depolymerase